MDREEARAEARGERELIVQVTPEATTRFASCRFQSHEITSANVTVPDIRTLAIAVVHCVGSKRGQHTPRQQ